LHAARAGVGWVSALPAAARRRRLKILGGIGDGRFPSPLGITPIRVFPSIDGKPRWLPCEPEQELNRLQALPGPKQPRRLRILIIDDNVDAARTLGALCEHFGHEVDFAYDGPSGLEAARRLRPDLIFADIVLPGLDGHELARQLRQDPLFRDVVMIAISGFAGEEDRQRSRESGFDDYLVKPADPAFIESLLRRP
jgi:CheY-like chemotaxis protein